eukprot:CAMPEP_0206322526 /NCGR_PEP_ID=MMETSP0106_2-20121207/19471_1 /ASSEMBLY_ACC=CAM_ASM_000206 /TAXON_ID=81532 /ORGANISM="Acanthoeca-like sp., Strain 10tr" /LENGTH=56 /DNA_ID=CAMNT_0053754701 /DNA_START=21 /DNA_END=187 /DNA_ORIENTATION=+
MATPLRGCRSTRCAAGRDSETPAWFVCSSSYGQEAACEALLARNADLNACDNGGKT